VTSEQSTPSPVPPSLLVRLRVNLFRQPESLVPADSIVHHGQQKTSHPHRRRVVHRVARHRQNRRERQPNNHEESVREREDVDGDAPATEMPRSSRHAVTPDLAQHEEEDWRQVREVERYRGQGDAGVEGGRGGEIDEGYETTEDGN